MSAQHRGQRLRQVLGRPLLADSGFFTAHGLNACSVNGITPLIAEKREAHSGCAGAQTGARVTPIRDPHYAAGRDAPSHGHAIGQGAPC